MNESTNNDHRQPYIGEGEDGARRSARIDREEADGLDIFDEHYDQLLKSAEEWEKQACELMLERVGVHPSLAQVRESVGSEEWLAGLALLELSPSVANDAAQWATWSTNGGTYTYTGEEEGKVSIFHPNPGLDWDAWAADVDERDRGWSSSGLVQLLGMIGQ